MSDDLGDRMKMYEQRWAGQKLMPGAPCMARIDGKCFSRWTKGLDRPYDLCLSNLMILVVKYLVEETNACIGYTQSDEITLVWPTLSNSFYEGKVQKITSVLGSMVTAKFNSLVPTILPQKTGDLALFDCRVWDLPSETEATNALLWREFDATKNSISMAARHYFSHKSLHSLNGKQMQEKLWQEEGINWNDYPDFFKRGTYVRRVKKLKELTSDELSVIPEKHRPTGPVERTVVERISMPPLVKIYNRVDVLFRGYDPVRIIENMNSGEENA